MVIQIEILKHGSQMEQYKWSYLNTEYEIILKCNSTNLKKELIDILLQLIPTY